MRNNWNGLYPEKHISPSLRSNIHYLRIYSATGETSLSLQSVDHKLLAPELWLCTALIFSHLRRHRSYEAYPSYPTGDGSIAFPDRIDYLHRSATIQKRFVLFCITYPLHRDRLCLLGVHIHVLYTDFSASRRSCLLVFPWFDTVTS